MKYLLALAPICALLFSAGCSQSPEKLVAAGNRYHDKKKYTEASILYQKAISKDKTDAEAYYREGLNLMDQGNYLDATKFLRRAVDLKPTNIDAESRLGQIYLTAYSANAKRFKTLLPEVRDLDAKILQQKPDSFDGLKLQGLLFLVDGKKDEAIQAFTKANQIKPYSRDLVTWYAEALMASQRQQDAEKLVRDTIAHDPKWGAGYDFLFLMYSRANDRAKAEAVLRERLQNDPTNPIAVQNLANYLAASNRFDEGEAVIKHVVDDKKDFPSGHEIAGDFYFRNKKFDQALQQYQSGASEGGKDASQYQERIVNVYQATGRRNDALNLAKTLSDKDPKNAPINEMYGALLLQNTTPGNGAKSVAELKALVQKNSEDAALHMELARAYFDNNETEKALNEAQQAMQQETKHNPPRPAVLIPARLIAARIYEDRGQHDKATEQANVVLQSQPKNPDARLVKDRALIGTGQAADAEPDLQALVQEFPRMNDAWLQLGNLALIQKQYDKATADFNHVWTSNPPDVRGFLGLQTVKLAQGKAPEAIQAMQDLVQKNPKALALRYQLAGFEAAGGAQVAKTDPARAKQLIQQAADDYKEILKTTANSADVWLRLGILQRELQQYPAALGSFEQAATADPRNAAAFLNQGLLLESMGKKKEATDAYNKVLGIDPDNALALNNLAFLNAEAGTNLDQAMTFAEHAKQRAPNSPDISDTLGYVYYQKNLNSQALQIFKQVVQDNPQNPTFHFHLAMALLKQGDRQGAKDEAQKAMKNAAPDQQNKIRSFVNQIG
jgi:tetratricopeptide (TPR) repeat protein